MADIIANSWCWWRRERLLGTSALFSDAPQTGPTVQPTGQLLNPFSTYEDDKVELVESTAQNHRTSWQRGAPRHELHSRSVFCQTKFTEPVIPLKLRARSISTFGRHITLFRRMFQSASQKMLPPYLYFLWVLLIVKDKLLSKLTRWYLR